MAVYLDDAPTPQLAPTLDLIVRRDEIHNAHDKAIENLIECGRLLVDTQAQLGDTSFVQFCDTYLKLSRSTAYNYMRLYQHSLVQRLDTLADAMINLSVWYIVEPGDSATVQKIKALAENGKPVTRELTRQLVQETAPLNEALLKAADTAPQYVADTIMQGTFTDLDGNDTPLIELSANDKFLEVAGNEHEYEKALRQKAHIQEGAKKKIKLECQLEMITDRNGVFYLALPQHVSLTLKDKQFTIYYEDEPTLESTESERNAA
jgi:hypothetical protein